MQDTKSALVKEVYMLRNRIDSVKGFTFSMQHITKNIDFQLGWYRGQNMVVSLSKDNGQYNSDIYGACL